MISKRLIRPRDWPLSGVDIQDFRGDGSHWRSRTAIHGSELAAACSCVGAGALVKEDAGLADAWCVRASVRPENPSEEKKAGARAKVNTTGYLPCRRFSSLSTGLLTKSRLRPPARVCTPFPSVHKISARQLRILDSRLKKKQSDFRLFGRLDD